MPDASTRTDRTDASVKEERVATAEIAPVLFILYVGQRVGLLIGFCLQISTSAAQGDTIATSTPRATIPIDRLRARANQAGAETEKRALVSFYFARPVFTFHDVFVADVNECDAGNDCHPNANCANTIGSYTCHCLPGYIGDGILCRGETSSLTSSNKF